MKIYIDRTNEFRIFGQVKNIELEYKQKADGTVVPICEIEVEAPYNGTSDIVKVTAFYERAENAAATIAPNDWIGVRGKLKGTKGDNKYTLELYAGTIEKAKEVEINGDSN